MIIGKVANQASPVIIFYTNNITYFFFLCKIKKIILPIFYEETIFLVLLLYLGYIFKIFKIIFNEIINN